MVPVGFAPSLSRQLRCGSLSCSSQTLLLALIENISDFWFSSHPNFPKIINSGLTMTSASCLSPYGCIHLCPTDVYVQLV